jgi:NADH-quinone oxidoreductase subunit M
VLVLAGVLPKIATYGLLRFNLALFPEASHYFSRLVSILALVGIVYGAVLAIAQTDLKRVVAYSSISHVGFIVLGIFSFRLEGVSGSVLYMVNHALSTGALFVLVGFLYERTRTRELGEMGGIASVTPRLATVFLVVALASMGLPGLNNFVSEFLVIVGAFIRNRVFGAVAVVGVALSAIYILWSYQRAMHGPPRERPTQWLDLRRAEYAVVVPLLAAILFLGVFPKPVLDGVKRGAVCVVRTDNTHPRRFVPRQQRNCPAYAVTAKGSRP